MKAVCIVAHPDDCVIFAYSLIKRFKNLGWCILYLTHDIQDARSQEVGRFWHRRGVRTEFLGIEDTEQISEPDLQCATDLIRSRIQDCGFVLTHGAMGEYGHAHHVLLHNIVMKLRPDAMTFAAPDKGTHQFVVRPIDYDVTELPLHWEMICNFHTDEHFNDYNIAPQTWSQLQICSTI